VSPDIRVLDGRPIVAPDGRTVAFAGIRDGQQQVYVRVLDSLEAPPVRGTEGGTPLGFSPDGQSLLVGVREAPQRIVRVPLDGGLPVTISEGQASLGASWGPDGTIVIGSAAGLSIVSAAGGEPQPLTTPADDDAMHARPQFLPNGRAVLFSLRTPAEQVAVYSLDTDEYEVLFPGVAPRYMPSGHLVFARGSTLWAVPFDADGLTLQGEPVPVVEDVSVGSTQVSLFDVSRDGALVYVPGGSVGTRRLVWVERDGREALVGMGPGLYDSPRVSPDGLFIAVQVGEDVANSDVLIHDLARGTTNPLTFDGQSFFPIWSSDSERVAFVSSSRGGLFWQAADGTGKPEVLLDFASAQPLMPLQFSNDGRTLLAGGVNPGTGSDIMTVSLDSDPTVDLLIQTAGDDFHPAVSPNGRWVAYESDDSGRSEVFVSPFPNVGGNKKQISATGGGSPVWSPSGGELFFRSGGVMMVVPVETDPAFTYDTPQVLFEAPYRRTVFGPRARPFDLSPNGRFLMIKEEPATDEAPNAPHFIFVEHWREELKERVPVS